MILKNNNSGDVLMSSPCDVNAEVSLQRLEVSYENLSDKFKCVSKDYTRQYAHIYAGRLHLMRDRVTKEARSRWGDVPLRKLSELGEDQQRSVVVGTLFKHQELKPSILKEISEENQLIPQPPRINYVSETDQLILEDDVQRIRLKGSLKVNKLVTGIVIALLGYQNDEGKFEVEEFCFGGAYNTIDIPIADFSDDCYLLLCSGLSLSSMTNLLSVQLLVDWVTGLLGSTVEQENRAKIVRVVIAGNCVKSSDAPINPVINTSVTDSSSVLSSIKLLDNILLQLVKSVEVDLMPGEFDPSNHTLPQQPIHYCMLPQCSRYQSFQGVTNPYLCSIGGRRVLGTSGQPIQDIKSLTDVEEPLEILECTLTWGHLAPTAPDTLACFPYYQDDPFVITQRPDVYFAGNQKSFQTKMAQCSDGSSVSLICVPSFATTQTVALVNLKTLAAVPVTFQTQSP